MRKVQPAWKKYAPELENYLAFDSIVFMQSTEDYAEAEEVLERDGIDGLFEYLMQWAGDCPNNVWDMAKHDELPFGATDTLYFRGDHCININYRYGYVGLYYCFNAEEYAKWCECF